MINTALALAKGIVGEANARINEPMSAHTTFRIGGPADIFVAPHSVSALVAVIKLFKQLGIDYQIIGNGSNLLVGDKGIRGAVIEIGKELGDVKFAGGTVTAESGVLLSKLANSAARNGLSGLEFASGIPGSLGGAVYMNAGAYGGEMKDVITKVTYLDDDCEVREISGADCGFGYRRSFFTDKSYVILSAEMELMHKSVSVIMEDIKNLTEKRVAKQPIDKASAGSTFKRPEGYYAAALIEEAGLKGYSVGGASVSEKHSGFVVNNGGATAADVMGVIDHVRETVLEKKGVRLETEVKLIGEF